MTKYSLELKFEVVQFVLVQRNSQRAAARHFGITKGHIQMWVAAYLHHGLEGLAAKNGTYTGDFKISVIEYMHKNGLSARQAAAEFNIPSLASIATWERKYLEEGASALHIDKRGRSANMDTDKKTRKPKVTNEVEEGLRAEVQRLRMENDYLKKLNALIQQREKSLKKIK
jgi:transposase